MSDGPTSSLHEGMAELDLRGVICPYNFVRTKLRLETMAPGELLSVLLDDGDPIRNVPASVQHEGHQVLAQEPLDSAFRVLIRRREEPTELTESPQAQSTPR